jgi:hypothetical protein
VLGGGYCAGPGMRLRRLEGGCVLGIPHNLRIHYPIGTVPSTASHMEKAWHFVEEPLQST